jgi:putative endonuclease
VSIRDWCDRWHHWRERNLPLGQRGEAIAARFLTRRGFRILARNYRNPQGEIDLIALQRQTVVFVEVRTRSATALGAPVETISAEKQRRLTRAALAFLKSHKLLEHSARFDVITIVWGSTRTEDVIEHFVNAFPAAD